MADVELPSPRVSPIDELAVGGESRPARARRHSRPRAGRPIRRSAYACCSRRAPVLRPVPLERLDLVQAAARDGQGFPLLPKDLDDRRVPRRAHDEYHFGRYIANSAILAVAVTRLQPRSSPRSAATRSRGFASRDARCSSCSSSAR